MAIQPQARSAARKSADTPQPFLDEIRRIVTDTIRDELRFQPDQLLRIDDVMRITGLRKSAIHADAGLAACRCYSGHSRVAFWSAKGVYQWVEDVKAGKAQR